MVAKAGRLLSSQRQEVSQQLAGDLGIFSSRLEGLSSIADRVANKFSDAFEILGAEQVCEL